MLAQERVVSNSLLINSGWTSDVCSQIEEIRFWNDFPIITEKAIKQVVKSKITFLQVTMLYNL